MKQINLAQSGFEMAKNTTRKRIFLEEMNKVVPWQALVALVESPAPPAVRGRQGGRPSFSVETMLRSTAILLGWMLVRHVFQVKQRYCVFVT